MVKKQIDTIFAIILLVGIAIIGTFFALSYWKIISITFPAIPGFPHISFPASKPKTDIKKFTSEEDFKSYLKEAETGLYMTGFGVGGGIIREAASLPLTAPMPEPQLKADEEALDRVSSTTVQVLGIDEPDIVKTDGKEIYFSPEYYYRFWEPELILEKGSVPPLPTAKTKIIKAFPPAYLGVDAEIGNTGNLLLKENILVIFSGDKIYGYDISNPKSPEKKWTMELENNNYVVGARLYKGKIYLINSTRIDDYRPCPIKPLSVEGVPLEIKCADIYHPVTNVPVDVTFTAMIVNPASGKIEKNISFIGSSGSSIVYMSEGNIYLTYSYSGDVVEFFYNFLNEECQNIAPAWVIDKFKKLISYDISDSAKMTELQVILEKWYGSLNNDERLKAENELTNRMGDYYKEHKRDLEKTGIAKIGLDNFEVLATNEVPGTPLNQFSLDEYQNHLRVATTIGESFWMWSIGGERESANDVYVLDKNLEITGSVKDLGLGERVYSVRFIEDKGYVVTFRQIDPFFVLDLSNPEKPELKGQLKIPGYSSYLHPITKDKILGIGKEGSNVKISLFGVTSPENPTELAKYTLNEYWSDILNTHHAFLLDKKHEIFFLPGSKGGYIFSYKDNQLKLTKAVSDIIAKRAIYINDYLYIIGDDKIVVLNELDWVKVNTLVFGPEY